MEYPIIQAPMAWITCAELAAAVSNTRGLGSLGPEAGKDPECNAHPIPAAVMNSNITHRWAPYGAIAGVIKMRFTPANLQIRRQALSLEQRDIIQNPSSPLSFPRTILSQQ